jgi:pimeloyl-ACP methyl ester carboxylesterase
MRILHRLLRYLLPALALLPVAANSAPARVQLERRALLGAVLAPAGAGQQGVLVRSVFPSLTAERIGVRPEDLILSISGTAVPSVPAAVAAMSSIKAGTPLKVTVRRGSATLQLSGKAVGQPFEAYPGARTDYGAVPFRGGYLRDILVTPEGQREAPVVFLLQGFSCTSIEPSSDKAAYRQLAKQLTAADIGFYRVEKPGVGDSIGKLRCPEIDYATELDAFRSAYRHLVTDLGVSPDRIFMLGHSLGGLEAPMLAAELAPRGIAVYGAVLRNWADYHQNVAAFQGYLALGKDPVAEAAEYEGLRDMFRRFYFERQSPKTIATDDPKLAQPLRDLLSWDGGEQTIGRNYRFLQDLAHLPLYAAWRDTHSNVLAMYGESDLIALFDTDHRLIADIANFYRPGTGTYVEIAGTEHGMTLVGNRRQFREIAMKTGAPPEGEFNPEITRVLAGWIRECMAKPPVRTLSGREDSKSGS